MATYYLLRLAPTMIIICLVACVNRVMLIKSLSKDFPVRDSSNYHEN